MTHMPRWLMVIGLLLFASTAFAGDAKPIRLAPDIVPLPEGFIEGAQAQKEYLMRHDVRPMMLKRAFKSAGRGHSPLDPVSLYDLTRMTGDVKLDPVAHTIQADIELEIIPLRQVDYEYFWLDEMDSIEVFLDGEPASVGQYETQGYHYLEVSFPTPMVADRPSVLRFRYSGVIDCDRSGFLSIPMCIFDEDESVFVMNYWLPTPASEGRLQLYQSELRITYPSGQVVGYTGKPDSHPVDNGDGTTTWTFRMNSLYSGGAFVADDYETFYEGAIIPDANASSGMRMVDVFIRLAHNQNLGPAWAAWYADILQDYSKDYIAYPTPFYVASEIPDAIGAGLGFYAGVLIPRSSFGNDPFTTNYGSLSIHAHETAHNWFPGLVLANEDLAPWLSEGFAEYSTLQFAGGRESWYLPAYMRYYTNIIVNAVPFETSVALTGDSHLYDDDNRYFYTTYYKGALVLMQLQRLVGDEAWFDAMRRYVADHLYKPVTTRELRESLEEYLDMDLANYFDHWVYGRGYPTYYVGLRREQTEDGWTAHVRVSQEEEIYVMPLDVWVATRDGGNDMVNGSIESNDPSVEIELACDSEPVRAFIDPEWKVHRLLRSEQPGDVNLSGEVDGLDLLYYGKSSGSDFWRSYDYLIEADLNLDSRVDAADLATIDLHFGEGLE